MARVIRIVLVGLFVGGWLAPAVAQGVVAAGRGNPRVTMGDGVALSTRFTGDAMAREALQSGRAVGLSLAAADFDGDRIDDLVSGYSVGMGGAVVLRLADADAIFPTGREALRRSETGDFREPFFPEGHVHSLPVSPDFLGAGDFDADGHTDVVAGARGDAALYLLSGDGRGSLARPTRIELPGRLTALEVADVNRRDLLADVVVAVDGVEGPRLLVFQRPDGAFRGEPEVIELPESGQSIVTGSFVEPHPVDIVVGCGSTLFLVSGRDRRLYRDPSGRSGAPRFLRTTECETPVEFLAGGFFREGPVEQLAVLFEDGSIRIVTGDDLVAGRIGDPATPFSGRYAGVSTMRRVRCSGLRFDNLLLGDPGRKRLHLLVPPEGVDPPASIFFDVVGDPPVASLPMRLNVDAVSDLVVLTRSGPSPIVVRSTPRATFTVNFNDFDEVDQNPGDGICDATGGNECTLRAAIEESNALAGSDVIYFDIGPEDETILLDSALPTITGPLTIDATTQPFGKVELDGSGLGSVTGLAMDSYADRVIRGLVINRFYKGIEVRAGLATLEGNYIGTDVNGFLDYGNTGDGVYVLGGSITVGVTLPNLISGNDGNGIYCSSPGTTSIIVVDNLIGSDVDGTSSVGNGGSGIRAESGSVLVSANLISGNGGPGVLLTGQTQGALVRDNEIGTEFGGGGALGNGGDGIYVDSSGVTVGGYGSGNVVSGNAGTGINLSSRADDGLVQGNHVGTNAAGTAALANGKGVATAAVDSTVGGAIPGLGNLISGNVNAGLEVGGDLTLRVFVLGNLIGTDVTGSVALGNGGAGVGLISGANRCTVGGPTAGERNVISGNDLQGIHVSGVSVQNSILGNYIGVASDGSSGLGNGGAGIELFGVGCCTTIGGTPASGNRIAFNGGGGVNVLTGAGHLISMNRIWNNSILGIDLGIPGVNPNDVGDLDFGANQLQNFPVLTAATRVGGTLIEGTLDSLANTTFTVELFASASCDVSGNGQGESFIGSGVVLTDGTGHADFSIMVPTTLPAGSVVTATATDDENNTSEFSSCAVALSPPGVPGVAPPLMAQKVGGNLELDWGAPTGSCGGNDYGVHQGSLAALTGGAYDHDSVACTTGGITTYTTTMPAGSLYFLISAVTASKEGSYGQDSIGAERPASLASCRPRSLAVCP